MITVSTEWVVSLGAMTCYNLPRKITVAFVEENGDLRGRIEDMPMELFETWANEAHGERKLRRVVKEAGEVFFTAYLKAHFERTR